MDVYSFRTNRVNKLKEFDSLLERYCNGSETDVQTVRRMTDEGFHFWLDRKIKAAKQAAAQQQRKGKRGN